MIALTIWDQHFQSPVTAGDPMQATRTLHDLGQSIWLDNITRELLNTRTLERYINEFSVTGLTSNPTIFDHAIGHSTSYDADIAGESAAGKSANDVFFALALADLARAADLTLKAAQDLHRRAGKPNLFIKIPGTPEGLPAIESATFAGIPVNVTLLFSREHYVAAAEAWLRGVERRIEAGLDPAVSSVASVFVSRWDVAVQGKVPGELSNRLGIAVGQRTYKAYRDFLASARFQRAANAGC